MIRRVFLQNWKSHERTELTFSRGTNVLVGQMGAGKSAVLDAISFALFGTFPALKARKIKLDQCIRNRPEQRDSARIEVVFEAGGEQYTVIREITKGKGTALSELRMGGALLEGPSSERVTERVSEILKVGYELFSRAVYSEQNQVDYFLQIPTGQRKRKIDELLGIVRFEEARKSLASVSNRMQGRPRRRWRSNTPLEQVRMGKVRSRRSRVSRIA